MRCFKKSLLLLLENFTGCPLLIFFHFFHGNSFSLIFGRNFHFLKFFDHNVTILYFANRNTAVIAFAKSRSIRGASHQPVFMGSCLTISHTCLLFLPSRRVSPCVLCPLMIGLTHNGGSVDVLLAW